MIALRQDLEVAPVEGAVKLEAGVNVRGMRDGYHTGAVWFVESTGEVWKPLVDRNGYPTKEVEALEAGAGLDIFPQNWRVEEAVGRRWLVREKAYIVPEDLPYDVVGEERLLEVERQIREYNARGWEVNDSIKLAREASRPYRFFVLDLSIGQYQGDDICLGADDRSHIDDLFKAAKLEFYVNLRQRGRDLSDPFVLKDRFGLAQTITELLPFRHVYASFMRPLSLVWASGLEDCLLLHEERSNWSGAVPHTWALSTKPLDEEVVKRFELKWAWSPVHSRKAKEKQLSER